MADYNTKTSQKGKRKQLLDVLLNAENEGVLEICQKAGIAVSTYYKYIKSEEFRNTINESVAISCTVKKPKVLRALDKQALKGNIPAIRTFLEFDGSLGHSGNQTVNVGVQAQPTHAQTDYDSPQAAITDIDKTIEELRAYRASIVAKQADRVNVGTKTHTIHPHTDTTTNEGV